MGYGVGDAGEPYSRFVAERDGGRVLAIGASGAWCGAVGGGHGGQPCENGCQVVCQQCQRVPDQQGERCVHDVLAGGTVVEKWFKRGRQGGLHTLNERDGGDAGSGGFGADGGRIGVGGLDGLGQVGPALRDGERGLDGEHGF